MLRFVVAEIFPRPRSAPGNKRLLFLQQRSGQPVDVLHVLGRCWCKCAPAEQLPDLEISGIVPCAVTEIVSEIVPTGSLLLRKHLGGNRYRGARPYQPQADAEISALQRTWPPRSHGVWRSGLSVGCFASSHRSELGNADHWPHLSWCRHWLRQ